jgi:hypothetical protein
MACLTACGTAGRELARDPKPDAGYLKDGPAVTLDAAAEQGTPSTLQLLDERTKENALLKTQIEELEKAARAADARAQAAEKETQSRATEAEQLKSFLEKAMAEQRELTGEILKSRIARLKVEQEMLRLKLADLVREPK